MGDITGRSDKVDSESQIACVNEIPALIWDVVPVEKGQPTSRSMINEAAKIK